MEHKPDGPAIEALMRQGFPEAKDGPRFTVESLDDSEVRLRLPFREDMLRPGNTIAGPVLMSLADSAVYVLLIRHLGREGMAAVTTNLNMSFLRRPAPSDLIAHGRLLKLGSRLATGDVSLHSVDTPQPVAQALVTYALPGGPKGATGPDFTPS